jgi:hypothetical protein
VQRCAAVFKGSDLGTEAAKLNGEWKKDKPFQAAVKAGQQLVKLEQMRAYVRDQLGVDADGEVTPEITAKIPACIMNPTEMVMICRKLRWTTACRNSMARPVQIRMTMSTGSMRSLRPDIMANRPGMVEECRNNTAIQAKAPAPMLAMCLPIHAAALLLDFLI